MTDSTTSKGWLHKTNFSEINEYPDQATVRLQVAQMHAMHYITLGIKEYSQWFPGKANVIANSLSCDNDRTDSELTQLFCTHCPSQIPEHFVIQALLSKIISWLTALLLRLPVRQQLQEKETRTKLGCGSNGPFTAAGLALTTLSLTTLLATRKSNSSSVCHGYMGSSLLKTVSCQTG